VHLVDPQKRASRKLAKSVPTSRLAGSKGLLLDGVYTLLGVRAETALSTVCTLCPWVESLTAFSNGKKCRDGSAAGRDRSTRLPPARNEGRDSAFVYGGASSWYGVCRPAGAHPSIDLPRPDGLGSVISRLRRSHVLSQSMAAAVPIIFFYTGDGAGATRSSVPSLRRY